jgi:GNAT superfamily N-acetyltransferase
MPETTIRPATVEELAHASAMRGAMAREMGQDWDARYAGWGERFAGYWRDKQIAGNAQCFLASYQGTIVGMAIASISDEYRRVAFGQVRGYVNGVYVAPELRRRGIGRELMKSAIAWLRDQGCVVARLRSSDEGRPLYTSLGFKPGSEMELSL